MNKRQIPKEPHVPKLSREAVRLLSDLCFRQNDEASADAIFVFGTPIALSETAHVIAGLLQRGLAKRVILTGGLPDYPDYPPHFLPESERLFHLLQAHEIPEGVEFFREEHSKNTLQNVTEAMKLVDFSLFERLLFVSRSFAGGRNYLTLKKFLPQLTILQKTFDAHHPRHKHLMSRDDWSNFPAGRSRIWGEFLRIKHYGEQGDLAYEEVREQVQTILKLTGF